jgi:hypothetical protein
LPPASSPLSWAGASSRIAISGLSRITIPF